MDAVVKLSIAMQSNPGVYALLLGSGVSRSAGIPTGWDVTLDLIRRVARVQLGADVTDPEHWYRTTFGEEPDYSRVLEKLSQSPSERSSILRAYFEATEEDRAEAKKIPTPAHRAIARLVQRGFVRVIVTTNFDRLLEQALEAIGVVPQVISTADMAEGAPPLVHSDATIIKVHGDYLDSRIKNTVAELDAYEPVIDKLLDRVFDEYGLVVCGWSGEWDAALRAAMSRCPTRRYGVYWAGLSKPVGEAERLMRHRRAEFIHIAGADEFFVSLDEKVHSLEDLGASNLLPPRLGAAMVKRYVVDPQARIRLHDLISHELKEVIRVTAPEANPILGDVTADMWGARLRKHEAATATLRAAIVTIVAWGTEEQQGLWENAVKSLARERSREGGLTGWIHQRRYAALLLAYAAGIAATARGAFHPLARMFGLPVTDAEFGTSGVGVILSPARVLEPNWMQSLFSERRKTPTSDYLHSVLREDFRDLLPDDADYDRTFDQLEYYWSLHCMCLDQAPIIGRFAWRGNGEVKRETDREVAENKAGWAPYGAGLFGSSFEKFAQARTELDQYTSRLRFGW